MLQNIAATFSAKLKIERMRAIQEQPVQTGVETCEPENFDIVFDHVKFAYRDGESVLEDVSSFTARQGQVTALVGPSGGGKSTACKLAARFWDIQGGKITLGGIDISTVDPETLLKHYSFVFQDVVLFRDTILENIRLGRRGATDEEVYAAARAARCDEFVRELPEGYQTVVGGENGSTLSGGERQRISIARALLKDAPVILLDEANRLPGRGERDRRAGGHLPPGEGQDRPHHRPPDADRGRCRPRGGTGGRRRGPGGRSGGAAGPERPLPPDGRAAAVRPSARRGPVPYGTGPRRHP